MAEPTKLPSAEEFNFMLSSVARDAAYAAALARVAELEAWQEVSLTMAEETHEVMDVVATQRDTALAELAVLRAALEQIARGPDDPRNYPARDTSIESHYEIVAIRALTALHEAEQERDTALARVAEKEAEKERQAGLSSGGASPSAYQHAIDRADALAAELSELRAAVGELFSYLDDTKTDSIFGLGDLEDRLRALAAQPQGERGKALLAERAAMKAAIEKYGRCTTCSGTGAPRDPCDGQYCRCKPGVGGRADTCWNCKGAKLQSWALAAIDGAQP